MINASTRQEQKWKNKDQTFCIRDNNLVEARKENKKSKNQRL